MLSDTNGEIVCDDVSLYVALLPLLSLLPTKSCVLRSPHTTIRGVAGVHAPAFVER